jgi:hypothetical protein
MAARTKRIVARQFSLHFGEFTAKFPIYAMTTEFSQSALADCASSK